MSCCNPGSRIKFLCSYGGRIIPRPSDGRLRYVGGHTRILSVNRLVSHSELMAKLEHLCGYSSLTLRCQLPPRDDDVGLDEVLISVKSDEDLANLIQEYHQASMMEGKDLKIRAILFTSPNHQIPTPGSCSTDLLSPSPKSADSDHHNHHQPLSAGGHRCRVSSPTLLTRPSPAVRYLSRRLGPGGGPPRREEVGLGRRCHHLQPSFRDCNHLLVGSHFEHQHH